MTEYLFPVLALMAAGCCWYAYRWGREDGRNEGFEEGLAKGRIEGPIQAVSPSAVGGPGAVPR